MKAPSDEIYDKSTQGTCGLQLCPCLHLFSCCCVPKTEEICREILWKFELIGVQDHSRSLTLLSFESSYATDWSDWSGTLCMKIWPIVDVLLRRRPRRSTCRRLNCALIRASMSSSVPKTDHNCCTVLNETGVSRWFRGSATWPADQEKARGVPTRSR